MAPTGLSELSVTESTETFPSTLNIEGEEIICAVILFEDECTPTTIAGQMSSPYVYTIGAPTLLIPKPNVMLSDCTTCTLSLSNSHSWLTEVGDNYEILIYVDAALAGISPHAIFTDVSV